MLRSYPTIFNLGHAAIAPLFDNWVLIDEKIDGSQFSFGMTIDGELVARSKNKDQSPGQQDKMFDRAAETVLSLAPMLVPGWTYRGEYLQKPRHNTMTYERIPKKHIIIFDIDTGHESYLDWDARDTEAHRIGLECVPVLFKGLHRGGYEMFKELLQAESILGGTKIEGVVIKAYGSYGRDKKTLMGKYVSEAFKERNHGKWHKGSGKPIQQIIGETFGAEARWRKAVQSLRDSGELENSPRDIGPLMRELHRDITEECKDEIKEMLWKWARKGILRSATRGVPAWYKDELSKQQFGEGEL